MNLEALLTGLDLPDHSVSALYNLLDQEHSFGRAAAMLQPVFRRSTLCKQAFSHLELVISNAIEMGVKVAHDHHYYYTLVATFKTYLLNLPFSFHYSSRSKVLFNQTCYICFITSFSYSSFYCKNIIYSVVIIWSCLQ